MSDNQEPSESETRPPPASKSSSATSKNDDEEEEATTTPSPAAAAEDKSHTFRKRRLSLTNLKELAAKADAMNQAENANAGTQVVKPSDEDHNPFAFEAPQLEPPVASSSNQNKHNEEEIHEEEDEKAHTFRKRRLSLTHNREQPAEGTLPEVKVHMDPHLKEAASAAAAAGTSSSVDGSVEHPSSQPPQKRSRRNSEATISSFETVDGVLKSKIVHAAELTTSQPTLNRATSTNRIYQLSAPPQQPNLLEQMIGNDSKNAPKWNKRHTRHLHEDERTLPFPRDIVGTFSCHGVEPIYDDDYFEDDDEDDDMWQQPLMNNNADPNRPTTAAKINQDRGGVAFPYGNCKRMALFAAYDGHGQGGELVSQFALHEIQHRLEKHPEFSTDLETAFKETFLAVDKALHDEVLIEPLYAGTTACVALLRDNILTCANAGDSRAVLARKQAKQNPESAPSWQAIDLTKDQNPDLPEEQARIERMGGYVSPPPEPGLSARVWLDAACTQIGLAMARSIGDHAVKPIGVIAEPVVTQHTITDDDDFLILASDGVWEFISSQEAVDVVAGNLDKGATGACQALIETAAAKWHDEEGDYRDDITALVIRLQHLWDRPSGNKGSPTPAKESSNDG